MVSLWLLLTALLTKLLAQDQLDKITAPPLDFVPRRPVIAFLIGMGVPLTSPLSVLTLTFLAFKLAQMDA
jgi:hypothetical protein